MNPCGNKLVKSISLVNDGYLINDKILIADNGVLYNDINNLKPYKNIPQYYFKIRDYLINKGATK